MAKKQKKQTKSTKRNQPVRPRVVVTRAKRPTLDKDAAQYAKLLADPINAALVHPIYAGGDGGYLLRADSTFVAGSNAGITSGFVQWTPGAIGPTGTDIVTGEAIATSTAAPGGAWGSGASGTSSSPGYSFLIANSSGARVVAACMQLAYVGPEQTRSGRIHYGQTTGGLIDVGDTPTVDGVAGSLPNWERTPQDIIQLTLRPGVGETIFEDPQATTLPQTKDRCAALTFAFAGLPAAVGLFVHLTVVYEWKPTVSKGLAASSSSRATQSNSMDDVLNYLQALGYEFVGRVGQATGSVIGAGVLAELNRRMSGTRLTGRQGLLTN